MSCGCFSRRRRSREEAPLVRSTDEPELYEADARGESYYGRISTLAEIKTGRRKGRKSDQEYVKIVPYFGPFAGRNVVFVIDSTRTLVAVDGVKISTHLDLTRRPVRDTCINFVHGIDTSSLASYEFHLPPPQPQSLQFLCKREIYLSGVLPPGTPLQEARKFDATPKQTVSVRVWPTNVCSTVKVRVPVRLSFGELAFYVREKLGLPPSHTVQFRESDGIYPLQPSRPLMQRHDFLECFVRQPRFPTSPSPCLLPVMLVGRGMAEIRVSSTTMIVELEDAIKQCFGLEDDTFLYIHSLFSPQLSHSAGLRMFVTANKRTALLIDRSARRFPIVSDSDLNRQFDHREIAPYNLTLGEAGLLHEGTPLLCFDVTGPTVPLSCKAYSTETAPTSNSGGSGSSGGTDGSGQYSNHMIVSVETRIMSINPNWTASTLLKYVDCVTRLPASRQLLLKDTIVPFDEKIGRFFDRDWIVPSPNGRPAISPNVLSVL